MRRQVLLVISILCLRSVFGQVSYSIPEEMTKGSLVGNIAQDLGLDVKRLKLGNAHVYSGDSREYIELNSERGVLLIKERIDREALCGDTTPCAVHFQIVLENPMEFYSVTVEITDINDNAPTFEKNEIKFIISESTVVRAKFDLERAVDSDVGTNSLQSYILKPTDNFLLKLHSQADGTKNVEMILQKPLDREKNEFISLMLTAVDGGEPQMSGTMQILITVLDANDNAPVFTQPIYKGTVAENAAKGTIVTTVSASDADHGLNGKITYSITNTLDDVRHIFEVNEENGEVRLIGRLDYEKKRNFQINVRARDNGGLTDSCKVIVDVVDINDNKPLIKIMTTDSRKSDCKFGRAGSQNVLIMDPSSTGTMQRIQNEKSILDEPDSPLEISDVNDNAPVFERSSYEAYIVENNTPGLSIFTVKARDADWNQNARVSYILEDSSVNGVPVSSYVSVSADSGVIHAVRSFDYEQIKDFHFRVKAQDGGSHPLSSNVTVKILIQDQNDNPLQVLYPVQTGGSLVAEMVPRSADVGYLVTKVVAVDVDSGQNAWLSYKLQKATDRALFEVGLQNGEIRTIRQVTDKDAVCRTTDSRKSDCKFGRAGSQNVLIMDPSSTGTMQRIQNEKSILDEPDFPLEVRIF
ncbi:protocadherin gamma-A11-like [Seriola lalandi dorsalis]|uniref:protocadherin gamma-A11-like n=1 Tax=Seriola lalandi dorsalis TaxID=1841481 RepID=UPI000C6F55BD|nr:protocadherin gamma-A11-like [Seriola lalandi dorsalis]